MLGGLFALVALRVAYYEYFELRPNMGPATAFFFLPFLWLLLLCIALPLEFILRRVTFKPVSRSQLVLVGSTYALLLSWWAFPSHWWVIVFFNPFVFRWLIGLRAA